MHACVVNLGRCNQKKTTLLHWKRERQLFDYSIRSCSNWRKAQCRTCVDLCSFYFSLQSRAQCNCHITKDTFGLFAIRYLSYICIHSLLLNAYISSHTLSNTAIHHISQTNQLQKIRHPFPLKSQPPPVALLNSATMSNKNSPTPAPQPPHPTRPPTSSPSSATTRKRKTFSLRRLQPALDGPIFKEGSRICLRCRLRRGRCHVYRSAFRSVRMCYQSFLMS